MSTGPETDVCAPPRAQLIVERFLAAVFLLLILPLVALVGLLIVAESGLPVLFRQLRVGRNGKLFWLYKFRTMKQGRSGLPITASGDGRITRIGRWLRRYKVDELPQFWNVLRGEMSLVGPRPEVPQFVDASDSRWRQVLSVRPGLADVATLVYCREERLLAAASDRLAFYRTVILPSKLSLNLAYLRVRSVWRDLGIVLLAIRYSALPGEFNPGSAVHRWLLGGSR